MEKIIQGYDGAKHASSSELASKNKKRGHTLENEYALRVNGQVILGVGKTDILENDGQTTSCKGAKKHIQILLQSKDQTINNFGKDHPISRYVESGSKVKIFKFNNNNKVKTIDIDDWKIKADELVEWLKNKENLRIVLNYIFSNRKINNIVVLEELINDAYKYKIEDVIDFYVNLQYIVYRTKGCKVAIKSSIPNITNKELVIFNFELRGSKGKIGSINYWTDAQRFYKSLKENLPFKIIKPK
jgi:hypothetical protein